MHDDSKAVEPMPTSVPGASGMSVLSRMALSVLALGMLFVAWQRFGHHDAIFVSSDGVFADSTCKFQGRGFHCVLFDFEEYRLVQQKDKVSLLRITPDSPWRFMWSRQEREDPMWKVPFRQQDVHPSWYLGSGITQGQIDEIRRRADAAFEFWCAQ